MPPPDTDSIHAERPGAPGRLRTDPEAKLGGPSCKGADRQPVQYAIFHHICHMIFRYRPNGLYEQSMTYDTQNFLGVTEN